MCKARKSARASQGFRALLRTAGLTCLITSSLLVTCAANQYEDVSARVTALHKSKYVRVLDSGKSSQGRLIPAFVVTDFSSASSQKARVLFVAGQHGNEYNPVRTILEYCEKLAEGANKNTLKRCIVIVVPTVNPDGIAANVRFNADNIDINRDWQALRTPETRFVDSLIKQWQPHVILDMHEWTGPSDVPGNAIEVAHISAIRQKEAMTELASSISSKSELTLILCSPHSDRRLFHRRYSEMGYSSYLLETAADLSYAKKSSAYTTAIEKAIQAVCENTELREQLSPASARFQVATVSQYLKPKAPTSPVDMRLWQLAVVLIGYCVILWVLKPLSTKKESAWSRRFVMCGVESEEVAHPLIKKRKPQSLLSRSWSHRRIRVRYLQDSDAEPASEAPIS
ncbi:MAG: DUF2817 domain-containing protein [Armatimonadota bacterium]|jgi:predicted deacylase